MILLEGEIRYRAIRVASATGTAYFERSSTTSSMHSYSAIVIHRELIYTTARK